jgi:hypothetical protein
MNNLRQIALETYACMIGLQLWDISVDGCITKAPCGGQKAGKSPVDRRKGGLKRSTVVDADGIPLGTVSAAANRHDSPLLLETLERVEVGNFLLDGARVHLDRGYDWHTTRQKLKDRSLEPMISEKGKPAPLEATKRWVVERTNSWNNAHKKLVWCTERRGQVIDFWIAFSEVVIIVRRLIRRGWTHYRWEGREVGAQRRGRVVRPTPSALASRFLAPFYGVTLNVQLLFWLPAVVEFWSRELPA